MALEVIATSSVAGGTINDDRVGAAPPLFWVIDGSTDVADTPLIGENSDAAWCAGAIEDVLKALPADW